MANNRQSSVSIQHTMADDLEDITIFTLTVPTRVLVDLSENQRQMMELMNENTLSLTKLAAIFTMVCEHIENEKRKGNHA